MSARIRAHLRNNVYGLIAIFIALGGTAYAAGTVGSADIVDNSVASVDLKNNDIRSGDVRDASFANGGLTGVDVRTGSLFGGHIGDESITSVDIANGTVGGSDIADESVTWADLKTGSVGSSEIQNASVAYEDLALDSVKSGEVVDFSLDGRDVSEAQFIRFAASMPAVSPNSCNSATVTGLPTDARDHLVLTEDSDTTAPHVFTLPAYRAGAGQMSIRICNLLSGFTEPARNHTFNLLVIDAK